MIRSGPTSKPHYCWKGRVCYWVRNEIATPVDFAVHLQWGRVVRSMFGPRSS
jgi:hypothetical protein